MKRIMKMCLSLFMAVVMVLGNCSFAAVTNSSAKNIYLQLEKKNLKAIEKVLSQNKILFDTNFSTLKEDIEIYGENLPSDLGNLKLKITGDIDNKKDYQYAKVSLGTKEVEKLSFEMIIKENVLMLQVPELYEKHISIDFSKLKEIFEKFGIEATEEEINQFTNLLFNAKTGSVLSKEDEEYLIKTLPKYAKMLSSLVDANHFTMNNSSKIEYNGKSLACKSVSYEVTFKEILSSLCELLKEVKNDEKLLDIFILMMNYNGEFDIEKDEIISGIDSAVYGIESELSSDDFDGMKLVSTLYYNTKKETLRREIKVVNTLYDLEEAISLTTINGSKNAYYELDYDDVKLADNVVKTNKKVEHNISVVSESIDYEYDEETYEFKEVPYTNTQNFKILIATPNKKQTIITGSMEGVDDKIVMEINKKQATNKKLDYNFVFTYDTNEVDYKIVVNYLLEKNVKITEKMFNNPEISIDKMSVEELTKEVEDNQEAITKKAESLFRELFPQTIKMVEDTQLRMVSRADKSTAAWIGKAIRIWETEVSTDFSLNISDRVTSVWREYSTFEGIEDYISLDNEPALENSKYYVCKNSEGKIIVGISNNGGADLPSPDSVMEADFDGSKSGVAYIEP